MRTLVTLSFIVGIVVIIGGVVNYRLAARSHETPQVISCDALLRDGPGDNVHVVVTDFRLHTDEFAVEGEKGSDLQSHWNVAFIPVSPARLGVVGNGGSYGLILQTGRAQEPGEIRGLGKDGRLHGTIVNSVTQLNPRAELLLKKSYPNTDFSKCLILAHETTPPSMQTAMITLWSGGGIVLACVMIGVVMGAAERRKERAEDVAFARETAF